MVVAAFFRNIAEGTEIMKIEQSVVDDLGPMLAILVVEVSMMAAFAHSITVRVMGRDYDAAVILTAFINFVR